MEQMMRQTEEIKAKPESHLAKRIANVIFGLMGIVLAFRLVFKALAANPDSGFVKIIYDITGPFVKLFEGIFDNITINDGAVRAVLEPSTLIAMIVVAIVAWLISALLTPRQHQHVEKTVIQGPVNPDTTQYTETQQQNNTKR